MQVFICWSGEASHEAAEAIKTFLEDTIQDVKPFLSSESIQKGGRWQTEVSANLSACNFGIVCLTKENLNSRWLLFEAGALSKDLAEGRLSGVLIGVESSAVESPLSQFQHTRTTKEEIYKLLEAINALVEPNRRTETQLRRSFEKSWPDLDKELQSASKIRSPAPEPVARNTESILTEVLDLVRALARDAETAKSMNAPWNSTLGIVTGASLGATTPYMSGPTGPNPLGGPIGAWTDPMRSNAGALSATEKNDASSGKGHSAAPPIKPLKT